MRQIAFFCAGLLLAGLGCTQRGDHAFKAKDGRKDFATDKANFIKITRGTESMELSKADQKPGSTDLATWKVEKPAGAAPQAMAQGRASDRGLLQDW